MKKLLYISVIIFLCPQLRAQEYFGNRYDYNGKLETLTNISVTDSGYFIVPTYLNQLIDGHPLIPAFIDLQGNITWLNEFSIDSVDFSVGNVIQVDSFFYMTGSKIYNTNNRDIYLYKFDANFDTIWTKTYGVDSINEFAVQIRLDSDTTFIILAQEYNTTVNVTDGDFSLYKVDMSGNLLWKKRDMSLLSNEGPFNLEILKDSTYLLTGYSYSFGNDLQSYVARWDSAGNKLWQVAYGTNINFGDCPAYGAATSDGGFILASCIGQTEGYGLNPSKMYIRKYAANNAYEWGREYASSTKISTLKSIIELPNGGGYVAGGNIQDSSLNESMNQLSGSMTQNIALLKIDLNGDSVWMHSYRVFNSTNGINYLEEVALTPDGGFVMAGYTSPPNLPDTGTQDIWIIKVDSLGCEQWGCQIINGVAETILPTQTMQVYPNPAKGELHVNFTAKLEEDITLYFYNLLGELVYTTTVYQNQNTIDVNKLPPGSYVLKTSNKLYQKVIINE